MRILTLLAVGLLLGTVAAGQGVVDSGVTASSVAESVLPDAPSAKTCGPKWAGGCWNPLAPRRSNYSVLRDPYFWAPTAADGIFLALDATVTSRGLDDHLCTEANPDMGPHPSNARIAGVSAAYFVGGSLIRFFVLKTIPADSHSKLVWLPRAISIGTAVRSGYVHVSGARKWFTDGCL